MNGISKSPSEDEKDNLGPEEESAISPQKAPDADDSEKDEDDGCSESELDEDKQGRLLSVSWNRHRHRLPPSAPPTFPLYFNKIIC